MATMISEAEAQRDIARILREAGKGQRFVVTADGRPVAEIVPPSDKPADRTYPPGVHPPGGKDRTSEEWAAAKAALLERLENQPGVHIEPWTREELYEE